MTINTKFNIGDFVVCNYHFGKITDIRAYCGSNGKVSIRYMVQGQCGWISEDQLALSSCEAAEEFLSYLAEHSRTTTTDDMY